MFNTWLGKPDSSSAVKARKVIVDSGAKVVVLTKKWAEQLTSLLGDCQAIVNPIESFEDPELDSSPPNTPREAGKLLLMGGPDPVKGASLAISATRIMRNQGREGTLLLTGVTPGHKWSRVAEAEGDEHDLADQAVVGHHHRHRAEQRLQVVRQLRAPGVPRVHGDVDTHPTVHRDLRTFKLELV